MKSEKESQPITRPPKEWAVRKGLFHKKSRRNPNDYDRPGTAFMVADCHYGWSQQDYHYHPEVFELSEVDFDAAMLCSSQFPAAELHEPAVTPFKKASK